MPKNSKHKQFARKHDRDFNSERFDYLQQLLHEFNITSSKDAKRQVLANIASFAYNPINFKNLRRLNIISTFLNSLKETDHRLREFSMSGLCNLSNDPINRQILYRNDGLSKVVDCFVKNTDNDNIIISTLTLLIFCKESDCELSESLSSEINKTVSKLLNTRKDKRIENLANIYRQLS